MRLIIAKVTLSSILLSSQAFAFPRPQVADNVDASDTSGSSLAGSAGANAVPNDGQGVGAGTVDPSDASSPPAATAGNGPASSASSFPPNVGLVDGQVISTPLTLDTSDTQSTPPTQVTHTASGGNATQIGHPGEVTGQLLGMSNCSGIFYNPKWDSCNEATGELTAKTEVNEKRSDKRQLSDDPNINAEHERDPTILSGVAGVDDGARPRATRVPGQRRRDNTRRAANNWNVPFENSDNSGISATGSSENPKPSEVESKSGQPTRSPGNNNFWNTPFELPQGQNKREAQEHTPGNTNFWNVPFDLPQGQNKRETQEHTPGNTNFWNVPFELPQGQGKRDTQNEGQERRQSSGTNNLRLSTGPLSGENRDLDGAIPYMQVSNPKARRQGDHSPHVEVGPPGIGGARNIIINKRNATTGSGSTGSGSNSNDPTGYLGALGRSGSGLNLEAPSRDAATPPRRLNSPNRRAQPDFRYVPPAHTGVNGGNRGADTPRAEVTKRQSGNSSTSNVPAPSSTQSGFLATLGAGEVAAAQESVRAFPPRSKKRQHTGQSEFDSVAPHHDGNHQIDPSQIGSNG